jgi:hypothetical protein
MSGSNRLGAAVRDVVQTLRKGLASHDNRQDPAAPMRADAWKSAR